MQTEKEEGRHSYVCHALAAVALFPIASFCDTPQCDCGGKLHSWARIQMNVFAGPYQVMGGRI